jgi:hypothetical protein
MVDVFSCGQAAVADKTTPSHQTRCKNEKGNPLFTPLLTVRHHRTLYTKAEGGRLKLAQHAVLGRPGNKVLALYQGTTLVVP